MVPVLNDNPTTWAVGEGISTVAGYCTLIRPHSPRPNSTFPAVPCSGPCKVAPPGAHCRADNSFPRLSVCNSAVCRAKLANYAPSNLATSPVSNPCVSICAAQSYRRHNFCAPVSTPIFSPGWQWSRSPRDFR